MWNRRVSCSNPRPAPLAFAPPDCITLALVTISRIPPLTAPRFHTLVHSAEALQANKRDRANIVTAPQTMYCFHAHTTCGVVLDILKNWYGIKVLATFVFNGIQMNDK